jgi:hypothetical protein
VATVEKGKRVREVMRGILSGLERLRTLPL